MMNGMDVGEIGKGCVGVPGNSEEPSFTAILTPLKALFLPVPKIRHFASEERREKRELRLQVIAPPLMALLHRTFNSCRSVEVYVEFENKPRSGSKSLIVTVFPKCSVPSSDVHRKASFEVLGLLNLGKLSY